MEGLLESWELLCAELMAAAQDFAVKVPGETQSIRRDLARFLELSAPASEAELRIRVFTALELRISWNHSFSEELASQIKTYAPERISEAGEGQHLDAALPRQEQPKRELAGGPAWESATIALPFPD